VRLDVSHSLAVILDDQERKNPGVANEPKKLSTWVGLDRAKALGVYLRLGRPCKARLISH
jgi:hypothetical protein